jgi:hypothetical protein
MMVMQNMSSERTDGEKVAQRLLNNFVSGLPSNTKSVSWG